MKKGQSHSEESRERARQAALARWKDPAERRAMSEKMKERGPVSDEQKQKISEGMKRSWERRRQAAAEKTPE